MGFVGLIGSIGCSVYCFFVSIFSVSGCECKDLRGRGFGLVFGRCSQFNGLQLRCFTRNGIGACAKGDLKRSRVILKCLLSYQP